LTAHNLAKIRDLEQVCPDCNAKNTIFTDPVEGKRVCKG